MPWRGPQTRGDFPSLGYEAADWIESHTVIPDGDRLGAPYLLTEEMLRFLVHYYRLTETGRLRYYGGQLMRPQKWGKDPLAAAVVWFEALGPCRFAGWDAHGEPVGRPLATPWIQCLATSEEQVDNTFRPIVTMATEGPLADWPGLDIGETRINLPGTGRIEPATAAARSRLGQRLTYATLTESHLMIASSGGVTMAAAVKRNLAGMDGRWLEVTNGYDPAEHSVAQITAEARAPGVLVDYRPPRTRVDLADDAELRAELEYVYGDSADTADGWVRIERIMAQIGDGSVTESDARRFFLNDIVAGQGRFVDPVLWTSLARIDTIPAREAVCLGFDGSRSDDHTVIWVARISNGQLFRGGWWAPEDIDGQWRVPRDQVDETMTRLFKAYRVAYLYADPFKWQDYLDRWSAKWPGKVVEFPTNIEKRMDDAIERFMQACKNGELGHSDDPILNQHIEDTVLVNGSRKRDREPGKSEFHRKLAKKKATVKIDAGVAAVLAYAARGYAVENGAGKATRSRVIDLNAALQGASNGAGEHPDHG